MLSDPLFYAIALACLVTVGILALGIGGFARGDSAERGRQSNRLMRWRIIAQFVAVLLIVLMIWIRGGS
jgi:uncharacterized membrane protein YidH (DUF202 family)